MPLDRLDHGVRLSDSRWFFRADASGRISVRTVTGFSDRFHLFGLCLVGYCNLAHRVLGVCQRGSVVAAAGLVLWSLTRHRFWFDVALGLGLDLTSDIDIGLGQGSVSSSYRLAVMCVLGAQRSVSRLGAVSTWTCNDLVISLANGHSSTLVFWISLSRCLVGPLVSEMSC